MLFRVPIPGTAKALFLLLLVAAFLPGCRNENPALAAFTEQYAQLHDAGDVDGLMELIAIGKDDPKVRRLVRLALSEETRWPLASLGFEPLAREESKALASTLPAEPLWRFIVTLDTEDRLTSVWMAGKTPDGIRLLLP